MGLLDLTRFRSIFAHKFKDLLKEPLEPAGKKGPKPYTLECNAQEPDEAD